MPIIAISRGSYSQGQEVAELVAEKLGYPCLAREVVLDASERYHVPEVKLIHAIEDPPTLFERLLHGKEGYIDYVRAALLKRFQADNLVYYGLLGHYFLPDVSHVVRVRVTADFALRTAVVMERDHVSEEEARNILQKSDHARHQWAMHLYGIDPADPSLYDLMVHVGRVSTADTAEIICRFAELSTFRATPASRALVNDLALAAEVLAILREHVPGVEVSASAGEVLVTAPPARVRAGTSNEFSSRYQGDLERRVREYTLPIEGIARIAVKVLARD